MSSELMTIKKVDATIAYFMAGKEEWIQLTTVLKSLGLDTSSCHKTAARIPESYKKLVDMSVFDSEQSSESERPLQYNNLRQGPVKQWFVNKAGVYRVVLTSNSPKAEPFLQWLELEVLPSIEKHGYYIDKAAVRQSPEKTEALYSDAQRLRVDERNFSAKVKQYFTQATDYNPEDETTQLFFAGLQNIFLYAVTRHTAAEIVVSRIDHMKERCGMVQDVPVVKANLKTSKNYLERPELQQLMNLCCMYLNWLESWELRKYPVTMQFLRTRFMDMLKDLDYDVLANFGHVRGKKRDQVVSRELERYNSLQKSVGGTIA